MQQFIIKNACCVAETIPPNSSTFVDEFYGVFELRRMVCGDSALFIGSFDILLNLDDIYIINFNKV